MVVEIETQANYHTIYTYSFMLTQTNNKGIKKPKQTF